MDRDDEAWAVFRCSLLSPLLLGEIPAAEREAYFRTLAAEQRRLPNGQRKRISVRTLRRWWKRLREQGVEGTVRRPRSDRGRPRSGLAPLLERAVELKKEQPRRSDVVINRILMQEFGRTVPRSTLYRHLRRQGATRRKLGDTQQKVRCRWSRDHAGALWVGDFEHGPPVIDGGRAVATRLSAWIDCHSRYVVEARYYFRENFDVLVDSLLRAWTQHGAPRELYVDNAKIYHAGPLKLACTELNIGLLHRPPRDPAPGGLIERFFQTLQGQLEAEIRAARLLSLAEINSALAAWLSQEYHAAVHSETGQSPGQRYHTATRVQRHVRLTSVIELFHRREQRLVHRDFSDVTIDGRHFAVDPSLRGDRLEVRLDPYQVLRPELFARAWPTISEFAQRGASREAHKEGPLRRGPFSHLTLSCLLRQQGCQELDCLREVPLAGMHDEVNRIEVGSAVEAAAEIRVPFDGGVHFATAWTDKREPALAVLAWPREVPDQPVCGDLVA